MKLYILYEHVSPEGKKYIGITSKKDPNDRWLSGEGYRYNKHFYNDIKKFGWNNFRHNILMVDLSEKDAVLYERKYIAKNKTTDRYYGYNITSGGEIYPGWTISKEQRHKMSVEAKKRMQNPELRRKVSEGTKKAMQRPEVRIKFLKAMNDPIRRKAISERNMNRKLSDETKEKLRQANLGKNNPNYGKKRKPLTEEQRRKISEGTKKAMANLSEESKLKMIEAAKNKIPWNKGKKCTEEQRKRISEGTKKAMQRPEVRSKCGLGMKNKALNNK